ncbi:MAG: division/cell wall cluster transcriptional repressor MraZ [Firmicutes bacterium]|nr:division/cell wall cluster transcriptional repressor MraZ [Bacillota bacterium]
MSEEIQQEYLFTGTYEHQLDDRGRMRMPAKMRLHLGEKFWLLRGWNNFLLVLPTAEIEKIKNKIKNVPITNVAAGKALRILLANAYEIEEDAQGRFVVPDRLKQYSNLSKDIVVTGVGKYCEIWDKSTYEKLQDIELTEEELINELSKFDI